VTIFQITWQHLQRSDALNRDEQLSNNKALSEALAARQVFVHQNGD
jgi:hypothetical protein